GKQAMYLHNAKYTPAPGRVGLLIVGAADPENTEMHIRKIEIMELPSEPTPEAAFRPLFNGRDFDGWQGTIADWRVEDKQLIGKAKKDTTSIYLLTTKDYEDFELRWQYRFPTVKGPTAAPTHALVRFHGTDRRNLQTPMFAVELSQDGPPRMARKHGAKNSDWSAAPNQGKPKDGWNDVRLFAQ